MGENKILTKWGMVLMCVIFFLFIALLFKTIKRKEGLSQNVTSTGTTAAPSASGKTAAPSAAGTTAAPAAAAGKTAAPAAAAGTTAAPFVSKTDPSGIYDDFYANIYDHLVFNNLKTSYEVGEILNITKPTNESIVLDIGSGTGHHVRLLQDNGINAIGVDVSPAMVKKAKEQFPKSKFAEGDANDSGLFERNTYTHILCLYFSVYYFKDKTAFFRNCMRWLMPGGYFVVHLVDREMFDPILPPANPLFLVSPQKYAKERITQSKVTFNNMDYVANFDLDSKLNTATFYEKFKDKETNNVRTNEHKFYMEPHTQIIAEARNLGFILYAKIDLIKVGYEYQYLYVFNKPM